MGGSSAPAAGGLQFIPGLPTGQGRTARVEVYLARRLAPVRDLSRGRPIAGAAARLSTIAKTKYRTWPGAMLRSAAPPALTGSLPIGDNSSPPNNTRED